MKRTIVTIGAFVLILSLLAGCGGTAAPASSAAPVAPAASPSAAAPAAPAAPSSSVPATPEPEAAAIAAITREDGSGTRSAFAELIGIANEDISPEAEIQGSTDAVVTGVAGNPDAISYISLGSLNDTVKAISVAGVEATIENVKSGAYAIQRPFNIATAGAPSAEAQDFINFIMSAEGQTVIADGGYVAADEAAAAFAGTNPTGKIVVGGSSSVSPIMEVLIEAYNALNPALEIELQTSDSGAGMTSTVEGVLNIGMASRELKEEELAALTPITIAQDGIAVIVNNESPVTDLTVETIASIFTGETTDWSAVQ